MVSEKTHPRKWARKWTRKWKRVALGLGLVITLVGILLVNYRVSIAQYLLDQAALQAKIPSFKGRIVEISHEQIILEELAAGIVKEVSLNKLQLDFDLLELWRGGSLDINADGLKVSLDVTGQKPLLGSLDALFSGEGEGAAKSMSALPFQPEVNLTNSVLNITAEPGLIVLPIAAEILGSSENTLQGWISFDGGKLGDHEPEEFYLSMIFSPSDLQIDWDIDWLEIGFKGEGAASFFLNEPGLSWNVYGDITGNLPVALLGSSIAEVKEIRGDIKLDGTGEISILGPVPDKWRSAVAPLLSGLKTATADLSVEVHAKALFHTGASIEGSIPLNIKQSDQNTQLSLNRNAHYLISGVDVDEALPSVLPVLLGGGVTGEFYQEGTEVSLSLAEERTYSGKLSGKVNGQTNFDLQYKGDFSGNLGKETNSLESTQGKLELIASNIELPEVVIGEARFEIGTSNHRGEGWNGDWKSALKNVVVPTGSSGAKGHLKVSHSTVDGKYRLNEKQLTIQDSTGNIQISSVLLPEVIEVKKPFSFEIQKLESALDLPVSDQSTITVSEISASTVIKALNVHLIEDGRDISVSRMKIDLLGEIDQNWKLKTTIVEVGLPDSLLKIGRVSSLFTTPFTPEGLPEDVNKIPFNMVLSGDLKSEDDKLALPEFRFLTKAEGALEQVKLHVETGLLKGATLAIADGSLNPKTLDGEFDIVLPKILFLEGGIQPEIFSPLLSDVKVQSGDFSGHAEIVLTKGTPDGHGYINVDIAEGEINDLPVKGLEGRFFFKGISAPRLPPGQSLKIKEIDAGVLITGVELLFGVLLEQEEPVVDLRMAGLKIAGGKINLKPDIFKILEDSQAIEFQVEKLDVKELFALIGRDDLSGTGMLSGQIPIRIEGDQVVVEGGHLATDGPGVLQIRSQVIADALASGGEQVELLVKALQNFNYTELSLDIDKPLNGAAQVRLGISGANKEVLDGHPFRLNINLETRVEPLLDVLLQGQQISQGLVSGFMKKR